MDLGHLRRELEQAQQRIVDLVYSSPLPSALIPKERENENLRSAVRVQPADGSLEVCADFLILTQPANTLEGPQIPTASRV